MKKQDLVSVIIPCYNAENFIEQTIRSVFQQSYKNFELICVDDGSIDSTVTIIQSLQQEYKINLISQPNSGALEARRTAITNANGRYIVFIDADDKVDINAIEISMAKMKSHNIDAVLWEFYSDDGINKSPMLTYKKEELITGLDALEQSIGRWSITGIGLFKKDISLKAYQLFDKFNLDACNSDEFLTRIYFSQSQFLLKSKIKYFYFYNPESTTRKFNFKWINELDTNRRIKELLIQINVINKLKKNIIDQYLNTILSITLIINLNKSNLTEAELTEFLNKCRDVVNDFSAREYFTWFFSSKKSLRKKIKYLRLIYCLNYELNSYFKLIK